MSYFSKFPLYLTTAGHKGPIGSGSKLQNQIIITDFFRRIRTGKEFSDVVIGLVPYVIKDGQTPEQVSFEFYGSAYYHWVVLLINNIVNPREEWPLESAQFNDMLTLRYEDTQSIHHYIDPISGFEVDSDFDGAEAVTVLEYESNINEQKRHIKMLDSRYLRQFVKMFETQILE